jgi:hypothetical protein
MAEAKTTCLVKTIWNSRNKVLTDEIKKRAQDTVQRFYVVMLIFLRYYKHKMFNNNNNNNMLLLLTDKCCKYIEH